MDEISIEHFNTTLTTTVEVQYPETKRIVINKCIGENYTEYTSFWQKLKLLFSKKSVYTKETKEM
jgi:glucose-6-phosphate 1-dehydrogenase